MSNPDRLPATIRPENVVAVIDTREQLPLDLCPVADCGGHTDHRRLLRPGLGGRGGNRAEVFDRFAIVHRHGTRAI